MDLYRKNNYKELEVTFGKCRADRVYVTAFPDAATLRKYVTDIAWETEVWQRAR